MKKHVLAVDIGASSGRLILGSLTNGKLQLDEVHRFENSIQKKGDYFCWDIDGLYNEIKKGIQKCTELGIKPDSIGVDTWAVDYVLLDEQGNRLTDAVAYRDSRTDGMMEKTFEKVMKERLYLETGIQFQKFNTIYQLMALKESDPEVLTQADSFLMIPDYIHYLLSGEKANEYTNATTTQLVNAFTKKWDQDLLTQLGINSHMFQEIAPPKTVLGGLKQELVDEFGFDMKVVLPATHDTGSAVLAMPESNDSIYISSGTWSLIGVENNFPICITKALDYNFTNEGGVDYQFRFLKNIMGLWMIQEVKRNFEHKYSFAELVELSKSADFSSIVNVDDDRFLLPEHMVTEIQNYCRESGQQVPETPGEVAKCVYDSLVVSYKNAIAQIEEIFEKEFKTVSVIGGGSQNELLNQLIADATGKEVYSGPVEATAIGNMVAQFMALGEIESVKEARELIKKSFEVKSFKPNTLK
ncbi:rhamnulokinase [Alkalihalobacillus trypoxylicola]|uniref:Rhamnulokinase n=1 Tax=Alkalihalobacillus trypoxylicola TaxID=519424 RepID=A0A161QA74_9BACI|nr:rhamnulokinase [Alkalihalobacillus trypoxylicola]KYG34371.1 rhamnulokinase [Alkalihalobacillus trypoxylicola]